MSYQALYRVWRPQRFDELVGQEVITTTLKNAIITNQISHAYLFAGPRGTGKTSAAKIFAKAVNCPNSKDGEPCNKCAICKAITKGTLNDVIEIDAASNNGVEEIRDVRDKAKYAPTEAKYKVYIIDEVHMLSIGAFNALLKTLEEPPENVIFILATTEPHKVPATIISRTQRFDFKRIKPQAILDRMEFILNSKKLKYDDRALKVIAKAAEGGMRDALSILDQALSYGDDTVTYENALQVTGSVTKQLLHEYFASVVDQNVKKALLDVQKIFEEGKDVNQFIDDMINYCQDILLYQQSPEMVEEAELGVLDDNFKSDAEAASDQLIYRIVEQLNGIQYQMHFSNHPDVYLEVLTVKIATLPKNVSKSNDSVNKHNAEEVQELNQQVKSLQNQLDELRQNQSENVKIIHAESESSNQSDEVSVPKKHVEENASVEKTNKEPEQNIADSIDVKAVYNVLDNATRDDVNRIKDVWSELQQSLSVTQQSILGDSVPVAASNDGVVIDFEFDFMYKRAFEDAHLLSEIDEGFSKTIGYAPKVIFIFNEQWLKLRDEYLKENHSISDDDSQNNNQVDDYHENINYDDQPPYDDPQDINYDNQPPYDEEPPQNPEDLFDAGSIDVNESKNQHSLNRSDENLPVDETDSANKSSANKEDKDIRRMKSLFGDALNIKND